ncbi:MAG TPA: 1-deoxy-D-xylulose-5-phosphate reductoisomerase [Candidatus Cybelea sp.]|jgi:1-deoxy-D-xylulose-5-phosphate reductoisomerase|nr:1-deoxy-D-xylulose-5-phosphate reductoisomerase [Candidatus Cybelea sp.]
MTLSRKRVAILGSTGSIGTQALDVIASHPERFEVVGLAAGRNEELLREQARRFGARVATTIADGAEGLLRVAVASEPQILLAATDGSVAFEAVFAAVERGIDVAVANKELIVSAGELLVESAQRSGARLLPVDSEHSAIFQCLAGEARESIAAIVLTASGGPFWRTSREAMERADLNAALAHPTWRMGTKNTIDSATMMNKGLEVIEASRLFGFPGDQIRIVVHPQSIAHGFVLFTDGSVKSQLAAPDMRLPIGYALAYPNRLPSVGEPVGSPVFENSVLQMLGAKQGEVTLRYDFEAPDPVRFPCVALAYEALARGGTAPAVLSAANEVAVDAFVRGKIGFGRISMVIEQTMEQARPAPASLQGVRSADREARANAQAIVEEVERSSNR